LAEVLIRDKLTFERGRRLVVTFAATTLQQSVSVNVTEYFLTLVAIVLLTVVTVGDRHSFFDFFLLRLPKASPALSLISEESELSFISTNDRWCALHRSDGSFKFSKLSFEVGCRSLFGWGRTSFLVFPGLHDRLLV
jgi:hypothetical protein